jgi:hypothetical protein
VPRSALERFLGFDPEAEAAAYEAAHPPAMLMVPSVSADELAKLKAAMAAPGADRGGVLLAVGGDTLAAALAANPHRVLIDALRVIGKQTGRFGDIVSACCKAQRALAAENSAACFSQGWIVGKAEDPDK